VKQIANDRVNLTLMVPAPFATDKYMSVLVRQKNRALKNSPQEGQVWHLTRLVRRQPLVSSMGSLPIFAVSPRRG
jgi:hypothetical protein